jgi:hypothetical protein
MDPETQTERQGMTRGEMFGVTAIALNLATLVFGGGAFWQTVQDHERRLASEEAKSDAIIPRIERIDANVELLIKQMDKERAK